jgi:hypothetical protein
VVVVGVLAEISGFGGLEAEVLVQQAVDGR